jgi:hypothetical protein
MKNKPVNTIAEENAKRLREGESILGRKVIIDAEHAALLVELAAHVGYREDMPPYEQLVKTVEWAIRCEHAAFVRKERKPAEWQDCPHSAQDWEVGRVTYCRECFRVVGKEVCIMHAPDPSVPDWCQKCGAFFDGDTWKAPAMKSERKAGT